MCSLSANFLYSIRSQIRSQKSKNTIPNRYFCLGTNKSHKMHFCGRNNTTHHTADFITYYSKYIFNCIAIILQKKNKYSIEISVLFLLKFTILYYTTAK